MNSCVKKYDMSRKGMENYTHSAKSKKFPKNVPDMFKMFFVSLCNIFPKFFVILRDYITNVIG